MDSKREEAKKNKIAFRYQDSWAELEKGNRTTSPIVRLRAGVAVSFRDAIKGEISFGANEIDSFVIMRNDIPTYNFACSIDDRGMSYIIRGEDHVSNTPKQILIKRALGFGEGVQYAHLPIILNEEHKKMSKRDKASSVEWLLSQGFEPQGIANYLILLGNAKLESKIGETFDLETCYEAFMLEQISSNPAQFDYKKIAQLSRDVMRMQKKEAFYPLFAKEVYQLESVQELDSLIMLYLGEVGSRHELREQIDSIFLGVDEKRERLKEFREEFDLLLSVMREHSSALFACDDYEAFKQMIVEKSKLKGKALFKPLRMILSGQEHGIELDGLYVAVRPHLTRLIRG